MSAVDPDRDIESRRAARKQRRRRRTRDEILEVAQAVVLRDGIEGFTLTSVAEEMGLTKPALYYYFDSKDAVLFELQLREWEGEARAVQEAVAATRTAANAVEALIRTVFGYYVDRLGLFILSHHAPVQGFGDRVRPEHIERIRPLNDMLYLGIEERARAEQAAGTFPATQDPRRFAFLAHTSTWGLLQTRALTAASHDPLIHTDDDLVDDLVAQHRRTATGG